MTARAAPLVLVCAAPLACSLVTPLDELTRGHGGDAGTAEDAPQSAGGPPVVLAAGLANPSSIAVDSGFVYWCNYSAGTIVRCPVDGCGNGPTLLASVPSSTIPAIAIDGTNLYFASKSTIDVNNGAIMRCPISGCGAGPVTMATAQNHPLFLATDGASVYWTNYGDGRVSFCPVSGCGAGQTVLANAGGGVGLGPHGIAVAGSAVYWAAEDGAIRKCAVSGCGGNPTVLATGQGAPWGIAVDATNVYWAAESDGTVMKCLLSGCGNHPDTVASGEAGPSTVGADPSGVYWTNETGGSVRACALSGCAGSLRTLGSGYKSPGGIAFDQKNAFVAVFGTGGSTPENDGSILRIPK